MEQRSSPDEGPLKEEVELIRARVKDDVDALASLYADRRLRFILEAIAHHSGTNSKELNGQAPSPPRRRAAEK